MALLCTGKILAQDISLPALRKQAQRVTIIRDNWGVPHIYGKTDADCAFGLMYAQCEDNFWQIEESCIRSLGRAAELYGAVALEGDASIALFECVKKAKWSYSTTTALMQSLCHAATAAVNYYIRLHADSVRLLHHFEPWYFLLGSTSGAGGHGIPRNEFKNNFVSREAWLEQKEAGSNTMALAPSRSKSGNALLLINPHVSFFEGGQRYEAHLISEEGLNVSGFAMLGDFYIWSGFNSYAAWSHTNTTSDYEDVYLEHFDNPADPALYRYGSGYLRETRWRDTISYKEGNGIKTKIYVFRKTHHGPVVAVHDSLPVTVKNATDNPAEFILQCWKMCRSKNIREFKAAMNMAQLTTNTLYADRDGNIAYWHGNAIPKRNPSFDWRSPVDGSDPETEWMGKHDMNEIVNVVNPSTGWTQNCNTSPYEAAGTGSPLREGHPAYMSYEEENFRSEEAKRLLSSVTKISFEDFSRLVVSPHLPMMAYWLPGMIRAFDRQRTLDAALTKYAPMVDSLRRWDHRYGLNSKATTLGVAVYYAYSDWARQQERRSRTVRFSRLFPASDSVAVLLIKNAVDDLLKNYGSAFINWGEINRLQRVHTSGDEKFDDNKMSVPVAAVPGAMGSLFAFNTRSDGQKKLYGISGNSYVAVVELGKKIKAQSIHNFGQSADPASPHYFDQAPIYATGHFKPVYFYLSDVRSHAEHIYHPGDKTNK